MCYEIFTQIRLPRILPRVKEKEMQLVESCLMKDVAVRYGDARYRSLISRVVRKKLNQCESGLKRSSSVREDGYFIIIKEKWPGLLVP